MLQRFAFIELIAVELHSVVVVDDARFRGTSVFLVVGMEAFPALMMRELDVEGGPACHISYNETVVECACYR